MKKLLSIILLALPVTAMAGNFDGGELRISSETWEFDGYGAFIKTTTGTDIRVTPSNNDSIDVEMFEMGTPNSDVNHFWTVDFYMDNVELVFINPELSNPDYQYDYDTDLGFHFQDVDDTYPPIVGVSVSTLFAPKGFDPSLIQFDQNNIYVNLRGSSCVTRAESNANNCDNMTSPTGLNNSITLNVEFEGDSEESDLNLDIDALFDWLEEVYPLDLPSHQESFYIQRNRVRHYPSMNVYIFSNAKNNSLHYYSSNANNMVYLGTLDDWIARSGGAAEKARKEEARKEEARQEEARKEEARQEEARQEEARQEEARQEEARQEEARQEEARQEEARIEQEWNEKAWNEDAWRTNGWNEDKWNQEKGGTEEESHEISKEDARQEETRQEEARKEEARQEEARKEEARQKQKWKNSRWK